VNQLIVGILILIGGMAYLLPVRVGMAVASRMRIGVIKDGLIMITITIESTTTDLTTHACA
jgi:hypothetical protein